MANPLVAPALVEATLVTYRSYKTGTAQSNPVPYLPMPSEFTAVVIVYGLLGLVPGEGQRVAALVGWGLVVATLLRLWTPGDSVQSQLAPATSPCASDKSSAAPSGGLTNNPALVASGSIITKLRTILGPNGL